MKLKTHKATAKKVRVTKGKKKKLLMKIAGQAHFNSRETGKVGRNKRGTVPVSKKDAKNIKRQLPYS